VSRDRTELEEQLSDPEVRRRVIATLALELEDADDPPASSFWQRAGPWLANLGALLVTALAFLIPSLEEQWDRLKVRSVVSAYVDVGRQLLQEQRYGEAALAFDRAQELSDNPPIELELDRLRAKTSMVLSDLEWRGPNPAGLDERSFILLEHLETQRAVDSRARAETLNHHGLFLVSQGRDREAETLFHAALARDPRVAGAHANLANLYLDAQRAGDAEAEYRRALALDPSDGDAHYDLGLLLEADARWPDAIAELRRASDLLGEDRDVLLALARVLERSGALSEASATRTRAQKLDPPPPPSAADDEG
jgi:tetratricopeptide (TPR) repeat protein